MAKKAAASGINKSEVIREYKSKNPGMGPKAIAEKLKTEHGEEVSAQFVSTVLSMAKKRDSKGGPKRGRGRPPGSGKAATAAKVVGKPTTGGLSVELLLKAKKLASELGGVEEAKAALDALARIMD
jgi:hypothetical protein